MLKTLLLALRRQPKSTRDQVALGVAGTFTALIFMGWLAIVPTKFVQDVNTEASSGTFSNFFDQVKEDGTAIQQNLVPPSEFVSTSTLSETDPMSLHSLPEATTDPTPTTTVSILATSSPRAYGEMLPPPYETPSSTRSRLSL